MKQLLNELQFRYIWQVKTNVLASLFVILSVINTTCAAETFIIGGYNGINPTDSASGPEIALALSGGGARGLASIGVIKAFEERGITIRAVAGTSMGGVIGGLYACGYSPEYLESVLDSIDFNSLFANSPKRSTMFLSGRKAREKYLISIGLDGFKPELPQALTGAQELTTLLTRLTNKPNYMARRDFSKLSIPFKTVGTDVISGQAVILDSGSLAESMRATLAFPLAFTGIKRGEELLMDGGMMVPVPVDIVRQMVKSYIPVVAVNCTSPLVSRDKLTSPVVIANQVTTIMTADKLTNQLNKADFVIEPANPNLSPSDFSDIKNIVAIGYQHGLKAADSILKIVKHDDNEELFNSSMLNLNCRDEKLYEKISNDLLKETFTTNQLIEKLKTLIRTEPIFQITIEIPNIRSDSIDMLEGNSDTTINVDIEPYLLRDSTKIIVIGNRIYDDWTIINQTDFPDSTISSEDLNRALDRIINLYRIGGHDMTEIRSVTIDFEKSNILLTIDEAIISDTDVDGNHRAKDWLVRSYIPLHPGEAYTTERATKGLSDLYGTDLFDRISIDLLPDDSGARMKIHVEERKNSQLRLGWHWHDEYDSEQFIQLLDNNVGGAGIEYLLHAQYGNDRQQFETGLKLNRIFFTYLTARIQTFYHLTDRNLYRSNGFVLGQRDEDSWGIRLFVGQQIKRLGTVSAGIGFEEVKLWDRPKRTKDKFGLRTLQFYSELESFNYSLYPTKGSKHILQLRFAGKLIGGEIEFTRFFTSFEAYNSIGKYFVYHPKITIGLSRRGLPASEKFYAGGLHSFYGFRTDELTGDKLIILNQELRLKLPFKFYLSGRVDIGDVYTSVEDIKIGKLRQGFGITLSYDSPVGPLDIGIGGGDSPRDHVYFSGGFQF